MRVDKQQLNNPLLAQIEELSGQSIRGCYQCGRCSAGCPAAMEMESLPHRVMRFLQLGWTDRAFTARAIWLCAACHTCASRCPRGVDLSRVMEAVRVCLLRKKNSFADIGSMISVSPDLPQQALVGGLRKYSH